jgi:hypothetical protein
MQIECAVHHGFTGERTARTAWLRAAKKVCSGFALRAQKRYSAQGEKILLRL